MLGSKCTHKKTMKKIGVKVEVINAKKRGIRGTIDDPNIKRRDWINKQSSHQLSQFSL